MKCDFSRIYFFEIIYKLLAYTTMYKKNVPYILYMYEEFGLLQVAKHIWNKHSCSVVLWRNSFVLRRWKGPAYSY